VTDPHIRPTTYRTKRFTCEAACELMRRTGCIVVARTTDQGMTIDVSIPADTTDIHSARYLDLKDNAQST
jgi:hypothetical protein